MRQRHWGCPVQTQGAPQETRSRRCSALGLGVGKHHSWACGSFAGRAEGKPGAVETQKAQQTENAVTAESVGAGEAMAAWGTTALKSRPQQYLLHGDRGHDSVRERGETCVYPGGGGTRQERNLNIASS